jgi:hypothetical protein
MTALRRQARVGLLLALLLGLSACGPAAAPPVEKPAAAGQAPPTANYIGKMSLLPTDGLAGTQVTASGTGLPANEQLELVWGTATGSWNLQGEYQESYNGREFSAATKPLGTVTTQKDGSFSQTFTVPEDFGFYHDVMVMQNGVIRNKAAFKVKMEASISPKSGPPGTPITISVNGLGAGKYDSFWKVFYDNKDTGFLSAVTTHGKARATITAAGQPGKHIIQVMEGAFTFAYRNIQESPYADMVPMAFEFEVTDGPALLPLPLAKQGLPVQMGTAPAGTGPALWATPVSAPVGTPVTLQGRGLPPETTVELVWNRMVGNRVTNGMYKEAAEVLAKVKTDSQGNLSYQFTTTDELGAAHRIQAKIGEKSLAEASVNIKPSALLIEPAAGPVGTTIHIQLKGVGWTETANIYTIVYDNAYIGYACGFSTQGTVNIYLQATGEPGYHFIDLYPAIYKGKEPIGVETFRIPQLTYAADHPGEELPGFHFAFEVRH